MFNKLVQTALTRRSFSTLTCMRTSKSMTVYQRSNNSNNRLAVTSNFSCLTQTNYAYKSGNKSSRNKKSSAESDDESDDDENFEELEETGKKITTVNVKSPRLDAVVKACFGISRNKAESTFYDSKIRVNGKKVTKKSGLVYESDEIDLVQSTSPNNPDMLIVSRVIVLKISENKGLYKFTIARDKNLTISSKPTDDDE